MRFPEQPEHFGRVLEQMWEEARRDYWASGQPFGRINRALDLWVMYGTRTTRN
jgi:hypothetical protein